MAKKQPPSASDIGRLKTRIAERSGSAENVEGNSPLRSLRKRLKRAQRRLRALAQRRAQAEGKKSETKPATTSSA